MPKKKSPKSVASNPSRLVPLLLIGLVLTLSLAAYFFWSVNKAKENGQVEQKTEQTLALAEPVSLPKPSYTGRMALEAALRARRSRRDFTSDKLNLRQVGQILWAGQGITADWGGRTAPSAKSAYPLKLYLAAYQVVDLEPGLYQYIPGEREVVHQIQLVKKGDLRQALGEAIGQNAAVNPPALIILTGDMGVMAKAFDNVRHDNNVYLEAGHAAQNIYLQAESLGLGTVTIAGFDEAKVRNVLSIPENETIIYALPFGIPKP